MSPKRKADAGETDRAVVEDFAQLMRKVPLEVFVRMVSGMGLPTDEARELCAAFERIKG